jgi:hypothetical protein
MYDPDQDDPDPEILLGCTLVRTCYACPEQYDVFIGETQIGYLRLRHGTFRADYPDYNGDTVYTVYPEGDGIFEPKERDKYLNEAILYLLARHFRDDTSAFVEHLLQSLRKSESFTI